MEGFRRKKKIVETFTLQVTFFLKIASLTYISIVKKVGHVRYKSQLNVFCEETSFLYMRLRSVTFLKWKQ